MIGRKTAIFRLLMLFLSVATPANAGVVIDIPIHNLTAGSWGPSSGESYGQIFTAPAGEAVLVDYSFRVAANLQFQFVSQVYAWGESGAIGPSLFTSGVVLTPLPLDSFATYVFSASIPVTAGHQYIAFVTNQPDGVPFGGPPDAGGSMALNQGNLYAGGQFAFNTSGNPAIGPWFLTLNNADAVFHATFVPEPATFILLGLGFAGLAGVATRARQRDAAHLARRARPAPANTANV